MRSGAGLLLLVLTVAATADPPLRRAPLAGTIEGPRPASPEGNACGVYDNGGPDGVNGFSNGIEEVIGARRSLLDDFVIPEGETWILDEFRWRHLWNISKPPVGTGLELALCADLDGTPGDLLQLILPTDYSEMGTGEVYFCRLEAESWVSFESVSLGPGHYWFEAAIVGPEIDFWLTASQQNSECWTRYEDLIPVLQSSSERFGDPSDLAWCVDGERITLPGACCFPSGDCAQLPFELCQSSGGVFQGVGAICNIAVCGLAGACCLPDATCVEVSELFCSLMSGAYVGIATSCADTECGMCGAFAPRVVYPAAGRPNAVELADVDGDGHLDFLVAHQDSNDVSVRLNLGDGTFGDETRYPGSNSAVALEAGDLDGDGAPDLFLPASDTVILLNRGDGTFEDPIVIDIPWAIDAALGDMNGDGHLDVVVARSAPDDVAVLLNDGTGALLKPSFFPAGNSPRAVLIADFDGDDIPDVAVPAFDDETVVVLFGDGAGNLGPPVAHPLLGAPFGVTSGDYNADGAVDLVVVYRVPWEFSVFFNQGDGTFGLPVAVPASVRPTEPASVDVDLDGDLDLIGATFAGLLVALNDGKGHFTVGEPFPEPMSNFELGDLDGDGAPDAAVIDSGGDVAGVMWNTCPTCRGDLDGSGAVDFADVLRILAAWGTTGGPEDLDGSGVVDFGDLLVVLAGWGRCAA